MATFTTIPSYETESTRRPRILSVKFGDGYEQRSLDGIHPDLQSWRLTFADRPIAEADAIEAFFVAARGGIDTFIWTPPRSAVASNWTCREWSRRPTGFDSDTITATFEEQPTA